MTLPVRDEKEGPTGLNEDLIAVLVRYGCEPLGVVMPEKQRLVIGDDARNSVLEDVEQTTWLAWVSSVLSRSDRLNPVDVVAGGERAAPSRRRRFVHCDPPSRGFRTLPGQQVAAASSGHVPQLLLMGCRSRYRRARLSSLTKPDSMSTVATMNDDEPAGPSGDRLRDAFGTDDELVAVSARLLRMVRNQLRAADDQVREASELSESAWRALVAARRSLDEVPADSGAIEQARQYLADVSRDLDRTKFRLLGHALQMLSDAQRALDDPDAWGVPTRQEVEDHFARRPMEPDDDEH